MSNAAEFKREWHLVKMGLTVSLVLALVPMVTLETVVYSFFVVF